MNLRRMFGALAALLIGSSALAAQDEKSWGVAVAKNKAGGADKIVRYRAEMPDWLKPIAYPALVVISWPIASANRMPSKDESALQYAFEDKIQAAEESARVGLLAAVATGEGKVEWFYYAKSHDQFMSVLNKALSGQPRLPIAISLEQDPSWSMHKILSSGK